jgi:hypothetical protein
MPYIYAVPEKHTSPYPAFNSSDVSVSLSFAFIQNFIGVKTKRPDFIVFSRSKE